ncbi:MFS transporter [Streptomyces shenzhenensis]|uniref:MFS transporter n=1 Tax=Streptomyces shenzhenensis TaxID=943815 RepID=UPI003D8DFEE8
MPSAPDRRMTPARTLIFAIAAGLAVGNLYWAQPLIEVIAASLGVSPSHAATLVTVTQIGYALGIFLLVPLGDVLNRRRLVPLVLALSAVALLGAALSPVFPVLLVLLGGVGLTAVGAQMLAPLASELADPESRGRVVGTVASGILTGVLLSRTISGLVADLLGWRAIYVIAAAATLVLAVVLRSVIPPLEPRESVPYLRLLGSVFTTVAHYRAAPATLAINAASFTVFSMFWTSLTYLLTAQPFSYSASQIGLVGLAGLAGALGARRAGVLHDRGWSVPATGIALAVLVASLLAAWAVSTSIVTLVIVVIVFDLAAQSISVLGQTRLFALPGSAQSRLNTALVVCNFLGGAVGSAAAGALWATGGWAAIMTAALAVILLALLVWGFTRNRLRETGAPVDAPVPYTKKATAAR